MIRKNIIELLTKLANGEKPFYEQDNLSKKMQAECSKMIKEVEDLQVLSDFFEDKIAPEIFHSHNLYLAHR